MHMFKKIIFLILVISSCLHNYSVAQQTISDLDSKNYLDFYILESNFDPGNYILGDIDKLGFLEYQWRKTPKTRPNNDRMITLRSSFVVDFNTGNESMHLAIFLSDYPYHIYLNGHLISSFGSFKDIYTSRKLYSSSIVFPVEFVNYQKDSINKLAIQLYPKQGEVTSFSQPFIASKKGVTTYLFWKDLLGYSLVRAISFLCFFISIYFFMIYFSRKKLFKNHYLYYALYNVFIAIAYVNNVVNYDFVNTFLFEKIVRTAFILQGASLTAFFLLYTNFPRKKIILKVVGFVSVIIAIIAITQPDLSSVNMIWSNLTSPFLLVLNILVLIISGWYLIKTLQFTAWLFFLTYLAHMIAAMHDLYYFVFIQIRPYVLFTPFFVFAFTLVIFLVLAQEQTKTYFLSIIQAKKLKELTENLEIKVNERTQQLSESVMKLNAEIEHHKETQLQLKSINAAKDKFFSIIAHDLKTPFHALLGYTNLLMHSIKDHDWDTTNKYIVLIRTATVNAYNLLENLLVWAGSQTENFKFSPVLFNIKDSILEIISLVENQALAKNISISNKVDNIEIYADKYMIDTVLRNLLSNAVKFTHLNGAINIDFEEEENDYKICVSDNGIGIADKDIDKLFRIDTKHTTLGTHDEKGTGLGLVLCKEFVEKHNGRIWVESVLNKGSKFCFTLPESNPKIGKNRNS
jgi:signal transduction histidine kinase